MNNTQQQVSGVVEGVGDKFNGSLKVGGKWYSNKKGFKNPAKTGDIVTLTLDAWEFNGKSGFSITDVSIKEGVKQAPKVEAAKTEQRESVAVEAKGRDFDAENRGKVRHGLVVALLPLVAQELITAGVARALVTQFVDFVMKGE